MISLLIVLLLIPVKVLYIQSDHVDMVLLNRQKEITLSQYHSVSLTNIESLLLANKDGLFVKSVIYIDQGGAGMPNPNDIGHSHAFKGELNQVLDLPVRFSKGSNNTLEASDLKVDFSGGGLLDIKRTSILFLLLDRIGVI